MIKTDNISHELDKHNYKKTKKERVRNSILKEYKVLDLHQTQ